MFPISSYMETWVTEHTVHVYENFIFFLKKIIMDKSRKTEKKTATD